jgi:cell division protein FtsW (lipid II flippase)
VLIVFTFQVAFYTVGYLGFQLLSQFTLSLISYGNIAMTINMSLIGIILSVFKLGDIVRDKKSSNKLNSSKFLEIVAGKLVIDIGIK